MTFFIAFQLLMSFFEKLDTCKEGIWNTLIFLYPYWLLLDANWPLIGNHYELLDDENYIGYILSFIFGDPGSIVFPEDGEPHIYMRCPSTFWSSTQLA